MIELEDVIGDYTTFLEAVLDAVEAEGFDINDFAQIDHMCYRTSSVENYHEMQSSLEAVANLVGETTVNGRPISTYRLIEPLYHDIWRIDAIELPAPKPGKQYDEGLEHIEFVIFDDIPTFLSKYDGKPFDLRAADRGINPEIGLSLGTYQVKFHLLSLPAVVYIENKIGIEEVND
jgi:predicted metalloenzyme YecM